MNKHYQSLIFIGDNNKLEKFLMDKFSFKSLNFPDHLIINRKTNKKSMGIAELSELKEFALLKSYTSSEKIIRIEDGETLTIEAQNSLLKILEEPPHNTLLIIRCNKFPNFLDTIFSRCQIFKSELEATEGVKEISENHNFLEIPFYERLELINKLASIKNPEEKQKSIEILLISITENLISKVEMGVGDRDKIEDLLQKITKVKEIRQKIRQNVNIKLSLDNLALIGDTN